MDAPIAIAVTIPARRGRPASTLVLVGLDVLRDEHELDERIAAHLAHTTKGKP